MKHASAIAAVLLGAFASPAFADDAAPSAPVAADEIAMTSVLPATAERKPATVKAAQNLRAGTVLHASDLTVEGDDASALAAFVGLELKRAAYTGKVLAASDVGPATAVARNAIVQLEFARGPLVITTEGRALDAGAVGDQVRVMNLTSKVVLTAVVSGPNKAVTR
jgi:flagella basal body P-ring formation protein FlgA